MENAPIPEGHSQADFIKDLNFDVDPEDPLTKAALEDHPENTWIDILGNGQLKKKTIKKGEKGFRPNRYDICKLILTEKVLVRDIIVEDHVEKTIQLGDVELVQGLDLAIALMEVGEIAEIEVASRFAYGVVGLKPHILPDETILYTIELKSTESEKEMEELDFHERKNIANQKRERGNWWYYHGESTLAVQCYRRALDFLSPTTDSSPGSTGGGEPDTGNKTVEESPSDSDLQALLEDRVKVYNNLAAAQIDIKAYDAALESVDNVLRCQPQNFKALYRKGTILDKKGQLTEAYDVLRQAAKLDPESQWVSKLLAKVQKKIARDTIKEKNLYRKMLGTPKGKDQKSTKDNSDLSKLLAQVKKKIAGYTIDEKNLYRKMFGTPKGKDQKSIKDNSEVEENSKSSAKIAAWSLFAGAVAAAAGVIAYRFVF